MNQNPAKKSGSLMIILFILAAACGQLAWASNSLAAVVAPKANCFTQDLEKDDENDEVKILQQYLIDNGYLNITSVTGYFGVKTKVAVKNWQKAMKISPRSGMVGPITRKKLNQLVSNCRLSEVKKEIPVEPVVKPVAEPIVAPAVTTATSNDQLTTTTPTQDTVVTTQTAGLPVLDLSAGKSETYQIDAADNQFQVFGAFGGALSVSFEPAAVEAGDNLQVTGINLADKPNLKLPQGYTRISGVYSYDVQGVTLAEKASINLTLPVTLGAGQYGMVLTYDETDQRWENLYATYDKNIGSLNAMTTINRATIVAVQAPAMVYGNASWYKYKGCMCAASPDYAKGTQLLVTDLNKNQTILVKINDWGPERDLFPQRVIDLDVVAFSKLGNKGIGVLNNIMVTTYDPSNFNEREMNLLEQGEAVPLAFDLIAPRAN